MVYDVQTYGLRCKKHRFMIDETMLYFSLLIINITTTVSSNHTMVIPALR